MADWYCSAAAYALIPIFQISHAYSVGDIITPIAPAAKAKWVLRCTTAGTSAASEPAWSSPNNATTVSGTATFTNVTGQSTYFWGAATGDLATLIGSVSTRPVPGDRVFISSDHVETQTTATWGSGPTSSFSWDVLRLICVNRAGSTPPVAADLSTGATITDTNASNAAFESYGEVLHYGINYVRSGGIYFNTGSYKINRFENCQLYLNSTTANLRINVNNSGSLHLHNSTLRFGAITHAVGAPLNFPFEVLWTGTASAIAGAIIPTVLFTAVSNSGSMTVTCRGVDLSAINTTLVLSGNNASKFLFDSCKIASGVTRYDRTSALGARDLVELVNCFDGTNIISERYTPAGTLTTERTITLSGGATDDVGVFAHKLVSTANVDKSVQPFESFWMDVEYTTTGASKTATVEIISSTALNNDEISLQLEFQGTAGTSLATFVDSLPTTLLTPAAAVASSTATWNSSPSTPQKQHLQVTFTPRVAGRVRGIVRLGKASTTVYINPQIAIT